MNRLEDDDACVPKDFGEYLFLYRVLEENGIPGYRKYRERVEKGEELYRRYSNIFWNGDDGHVSGTRSVDLGYNVLTVSEFLLKAGIDIESDGVSIGYSRWLHNHGNPLKHKFTR